MAKRPEPQAHEDHRRNVNKDLRQSGQTGIGGANTDVEASCTCDCSIPNDRAGELASMTTVPTTSPMTIETP
ncbi:MAG TPA: hypothetical protein DCQ04_07735 [Actinobacteria bacterium]|nr:hypothetical protein [Actinomycetota bacterium]